MANVGTEAFVYASVLAAGFDIPFTEFWSCFIDTVGVYGGLLGNDCMILPNICRSYGLKTKSTECGRRHLRQVFVSQAPIEPDDADAGFSGSWDSILEQLLLSYKSFRVGWTAKLRREKEVLHVNDDESAVRWMYGDG